MILSDRDIRKAIDDGLIKLDPAPDLAEQLGSCSLDLRLSNVFRVFNHSHFPYVDPRESYKDESLMKKIEVEGERPFIMQPHDFVLASTIESIELPDDLLGRLEGRSSLGRLGIIVHSTAAVFDPGWRGNATMEIGNLGRMPVALYPGMRVCSMTFEQLSTPADVPYYRKKGAKYVGQKEPEMSKIGKDNL